jgi:hypothetical protein
MKMNERFVELNFSTNQRTIHVATCIRRVDKADACSVVTAKILIFFSQSKERVVIVRLQNLIVWLRFYTQFNKSSVVEHKRY